VITQLVDQDYCADLQRVSRTWQLWLLPNDIDVDYELVKQITFNPQSLLTWFWMANVIPFYLLYLLSFFQLPNLGRH